MSTNWPFAETQPDETILAQGFPPPVHPAEPDLFSRQVAMPSHDQARVEASHVLVVGCGGLGGWIALALARKGVRHLTLVDPDRFDRTNAPRQLLFADELGQPKAHAVAGAIAPHMVNPGEIHAMATTVEDVTHRLESAPDALVVGVDNNAARLASSAYAKSLGIPAVFVMLSKDGQRAQAFLQHSAGPCLSCVLPDMDARSVAPCAAASIASCFLAVSHAVAMLMDGVMHSMPTLPTWRETSLDGSTERIGRPQIRSSCSCARLRS